MTVFGICTVSMACALLLCAHAAAGEVTATPDNIQAVLDSVKPGDTVLLADGLYKGSLHVRTSGEEGAPITIKAAGKGAVIDGGRDALSLDGVSWVTVEGLRVQNASRAGIYVHQTGREKPYASHVTIRNCVAADNRVWGIITSHIDHFTVERCETYGSEIEHGIYVANASDYPIIRNNIVHHNAGNGIHINGDPDCGGNGLIRYCVAENNVIFENGKKGGSALSIMQVQDSIFRNNLIYHNYAHGITLFWYTGDEDVHSSKRNRVFNNTVFFRPGEGRFSLLMRRSATDCKVKNNLFIGGARGAMYIEPSCLAGLDITNNVIFNHPGQRLFGDTLEGASFDSEEGAEERIAEWKRLGFEPDTSDGVEIAIEKWLQKGYDRDSIIGEMPQFAAPDEGDYHLLPRSPGVDSGAALAEEVPVDIDGTARPQGAGFDIGCYETGGE